MRRPTLAIALASIAVLLAVVAGPAAAQSKVDLVFSAGPTGGSWTPMAAATAEVIKRKFPELDVQVEPGAALVNMEKIRADKADLGWSMTTVLSDARAGANTWKGKQTDKPMFVANYYPNVWQLAVTADSDVRKFADLKGKAVGLPPDDFAQAGSDIGDLIAHPDTFSFLVAFIAGIAGMLSLSTAKSGALIGVLISVTTIPAAAYIGDTTLAQSMWWIARAEGLVVRVQWLPPEGSRHADRRALAVRLHDEIARALGDEPQHGEN